ncbi:MAG: LamG domain-containing protein [Sedimentisphaerales bacterium]|nr:LamG domain-containing protein [Sedimentisphaerales bacterium]
MCKQLIYFFSFVLVLTLAGSTFAAVDPSLVIFYDFEGFGSNPFVLDKSGHGNDAVVVGSVSGLAGAGYTGSEVCQITGNGSYLDLNGPEFPLEDIPTTAFTLAYWMKPEDTGDTQTIFSALADPHSWCHGGYIRNGQYRAHVGDSANNYIIDGYEGTVEFGVWHHMACTWELVPGEYGGGAMYIDGELVAEYGNDFVEAPPGVPAADNWGSVNHGGARIGMDVDDSWQFNGLLDDFFVFKRALSPAEIKKLMQGIESPVALGPVPADGSIHTDTWANISWYPGDSAASHDVYFSDNYDAVNEGAEDAFIGNQTATFMVVGFPGFAYPDGLVPGTTYYWRIDEVNDTEPNSPWKGDIWSFLVPPKTAYAPDPADAAEYVNPDVTLSWTAGFGAKLHTVYFGDNFDEVSNATGSQTQGTLTFTPDALKTAETYYWRVDEFDAVETHKGDVWSFITQGAVSSPNPAKGAVDVKQTPILTWSPGVFGASYEIYFGTDASALELKESGNLGSESYDPGQLEWNTTYYWRIDEANNANTDSPWTGPLWSFTTANFLVIDDMESYNDLDTTDPQSNRIFLAWADGLDDPANGSLVGYDNPPFTEQIIVHSGLQSMPFVYDNAPGKSEATLTLSSNRDWTVNGVNTLAIWFKGSSSNAAEQMYVVLNDNAVVTNDNPDAAQASWTQWDIDLTRFADQGVDLTNVNSITLGLGNRNNPVAGGSGMMYFDDIRLYPPVP